ncbi:Clp protease N-terminal domain-containing protein [Gordonia sp. HY285]|uniref:Clp protease N-terminal domain-containing protein n=1 Tax=Gordonia liuliyuniae TaxID=2911517 RepID=UPI001F45DD25|nr:Clp protease N-terminal domain-containing protein [Gordonia liuliyuniae]MCF8611993.1 Clp protease N-terminal domain-containing protein [Gordonia liuliyuniae]
MFDRFSREDRTLFMFATQEARDLGHSTLGNDHLILGMLCNARSPIFGVLGELGFTLDGARKVVAEHHEDNDEPSTPDADGRYEEDKEALRSIGIDLNRVREAVQSKFGDDLADGWGERSGRGRGRGRGGDCGERHGRGPHGRGRGPGFGWPADAPGFGPGFGPGFSGPGWDPEGPWDGGRGRRGPRGRGRARMNGPVRDSLRSAVMLARTRGDDRIGVAHLMLGILDADDDASRTVIEAVTDRATLRANVEAMLEPAAV